MTLYIVSFLEIFLHHDKDNVTVDIDIDGLSNIGSNDEKIVVPTSKGARKHQKNTNIISSTVNC